MQGTILLVEDEAAIAAFVQTALEREGFAVEVVKDGRQALARVNQALPDLIILDLMLPGVNGLEVCRAVRRMPTYVPIIMLTARDEDVDKVVGLELGADDYITKPFNTRELIARVRAVLRLAQSRATMEEADRLRIGRLEIDLTGRTVTVGGQPVDLTPREFDLLVLLASHPGRVFGRETLLLQASPRLPRVLADPDRLQQVFINLLDNAIKYSSGGATATIRLGHEGNVVRVEVADTDPGIAAEDLPHIFEPMYRGSTAAIRAALGTGLGLTIVKTILEQHGATISVESAPGEGTTFTFHLPCA